MHYLDGIFLVVLIAFLLMGFRDGIVKGGATVVSLVIGLVFATRSMHRLGEILTSVWDIHEVVAAVLAFLLMGFRDGIVKGGATVVSLVIGLVIATRSMHRIGEILTSVWDIHEVVAAVLAFLLVFFGIIVVQVILVGLIRRGSGPPRLWSRFGGAAFGAIEGGIYLSLLLIFLNLYDVPTQRARNQSFSYRSIRNFASEVFDRANGLFPGSTTFSDELKKTFEKFKFFPLD